MSYRKNRKRKIIEQRLGSAGNPLPAGPFDPMNHSKFVVYQNLTRYRGKKQLIAYRKDNVPKKETKNNQGEYSRRIKWAPHHEGMITNHNERSVENVGTKWFKSSLTNATFDQIKECYVLFESFRMQAD